MATIMTARTDYDFAHLVDLNRVSAKTRDKTWVMMRRGIILAAAVACTGLGISVLAQRQGDVKQAGIYIFIGLVLFGMFVFFPHVSAWRVKGKMKKNPVSDEFEFGDYGIDITRGQQSVRYPYSDCDTLLETHMAFYLFHERGQGLVISKSQIQGGTPDELRTLLEEKCGVKSRWVGHRKQTI